MALPTGVVYYPFIRIPQHEAMTRLLLYWDDVATIVPDLWADYSAESRRELLGEFTDKLVDAGLVTMAVPDWTLGESLAPFKEYLVGLPDNIRDRRVRQFENGPRTRVHRGKFADSGLLQFLSDPRLASESSDPMWIEVEPDTANEFMAALALVVGMGSPSIMFRGPRTRRIPVTTHRPALSAFEGVDSGVKARDPMAELSRIRTSVLDDVFPAPKSLVSADWIIDVRARYGDLLRDFRLAVEGRILEILQTPVDTRDWTKDLRTDQMNRDMERIEDALKDHPLDRVERITFAVLQELPGLGRLFKVARAVASEVDTPAVPSATLETDLAYGAFIRTELSALS